MRSGPRFSDVRALTPVEIQNLLDRAVLADAIDGRGWDVRLTGYAEKLELLPRLIRTIVEQQRALTRRGDGERSAAPQPERDNGSGGAHLNPLQQAIDFDRYNARLRAIGAEILESVYTQRGWERRDERSIAITIAAKALLEAASIDARRGEA